MKIFRILILSLCLGYCYANLIMAFDLPLVKQMENWLAGQMNQQQIPWKLFLGVLAAGIIPFTCAFLYARSHKWLVSGLSILVAVHVVGNRQSDLWDVNGVLSFFEPLTTNSVNVTTLTYLLLIIIWPVIYVTLLMRADKAVN
ncbi:hypothetical protein [Thalassotalea mangrovi]|uniref:Uncharacterized protein n=1 Tax=Thalassotalea mangrovi TaxID=2572245 RepID=A0A4U1B4C7_9GAMM|nr:hypothetical protein [Thalassotalea mangrovi]TKB44873.1 hypothetical protein E8M12_10220 [Thalassotalea mangrovi]